jgi:hypothetical protein
MTCSCKLIYTVTVISNVTGLGHSTDHDSYPCAIRDYDGACGDDGNKYVELRQGDNVVVSYTNRDGYRSYRGQSCSS